MVKILWVSPFCVHDLTNEAALQIRNMIESLGQRNAAVAILATTTFTSGSFSTAAPVIRELMSQQKKDFVLDNRNIKYIYLRTQSAKLSDITSTEQQNYIARFSSIVTTFKPEIIITSGSDIMSSTCLNEAKRRGIPTIFILNEAPVCDFDFPDIDLILSTSHALTDQCVDTQKHRVGHIGPFLTPHGPLAQGRTTRLSGRKRLLFVNPQPVLGLGIFLQFSRMAAKDPILQQYTCTVLEFQEHQFARAVSSMRSEKGLHRLVPSNFAGSVTVLPVSTNLNLLFGDTKLLMMPTVALTYCSKIAIEAISYCVPVITSDQASLKEQLGDSATYVNVSQELIDEHMFLPSRASVEPWIEAAKACLEQNDTILERCNNTVESFLHYDGENRLALALLPYIAHQCGINPNFYRQGDFELPQVEIDIHRIPNSNEKTKDEYKAIEAEFARKNRQRLEKQRQAELSAQLLAQRAQQIQMELEKSVGIMDVQADTLSREEMTMLNQARADLNLPPAETPMAQPMATSSLSPERRLAIAQGLSNVPFHIFAKDPDALPGLVDTNEANEETNDTETITADQDTVIENSMAHIPAYQEPKTEPIAAVNKKKKTRLKKSIVASVQKPLTIAQKVDLLDDGPFALHNKEALFKDVPQNRRDKQEMAEYKKALEIARAEAEASVAPEDNENTVAPPVATTPVASQPKATVIKKNPKLQPVHTTPHIEERIVDITPPQKSATSLAKEIGDLLEAAGEDTTIRLFTPEKVHDLLIAYTENKKRGRKPKLQCLLESLQIAFRAEQSLQKSIEAHNKLLNQTDMEYTKGTINRHTIEKNSQQALLEHTRLQITALIQHIKAEQANVKAREEQKLRRALNKKE